MINKMIYKKIKGYKLLYQLFREYGNNAFTSIFKTIILKFFKRGALLYPKGARKCFRRR